MSTTLQHAASIACPPETLYAYVTQPWRWHEWHPSSRSAQATVQALAVGDGFDEVIELQPFAPLPLTLRRDVRYRVLEAEPPRRWVVEGRMRSGWLRISYAFAPESGGTRFERTLEYRAEGALRLLLPLLRRRNAAMSVLALENLKRRMESR